MSYIKSNRTKTYTAGSTITKGYAVKLKDNEYVYPCDYTYIAPINSGTFGYSTSSKIENVAYVTATNQVLAVGKVNNLPHLYVGTINTVAKTIAWNTPIQLSAVQVDPLSSIWIKYDDTLNRAFISYAKVTTLVPHCITLTRTNSSYAIGTEADLTSGVASVSIKLTSDGTYFYLMSITSANQVKIHKVDATASTITTITTSATPIWFANDLDIFYYKPDMIVIIVYVAGSCFITNWNPSTNTFATNVNISTIPAPSGNKVFAFYQGGTSIKVFLQNSISGYAYSFSYQNDNSVASLSTINTYSGSGGVVVGGVYRISANEVIINALDASSNPIVLRYDISGSPIVYESPTAFSYGVQFGDGTNYYVLKYNTTTKLSYTSIATTNVDAYPIVGIAQADALINEEVEVAIENQTSVVHSGLNISETYYATTTGAITNTVTKDVLGTALSATELNISFSSSKITKPSLVIIDNSIADPSLITVAGRYIVPAVGTVGDFIGRENQYADFDGINFSYITPVNNDKITIVTGSNVGKVYTYSAGVWTLTAQATSLPISNWLLTSAYNVNDIAINNGTIYQANANIPANTPFQVGTTGTTWKALNNQTTIPISTMFVRSTSQQANVALNSNVKFDVIDYNIGTDISYNNSTYIFTLKTGRTYKLTGIIPWASDIWAQWGWFNITGNVEIGSRGHLENVNNIGNIGGTGMAVAYITPTVTTQVAFRTVRQPIVGGTDLGDTLAIGAQSNATIEAINGTIPAIGTQVDNSFYSLSSIPTTAGGSFGLTLKQGNLPVSSNTITLKANTTYRLYANLSLRSTWYAYKWVDSSVVQLPNSNIGASFSVSSTDAGAQSGALAYISVGSTPLSVKLVQEGSSGYDSSPAAIAFNIQYSSIEIIQIGTSSQLAPPASTGIIGTDFNGNFLQTSVSKILNAGTVSTNFLTLDNIKIWVVNNGNVSLSTVSGSINIDLSGIATFSTGSSTPATASNISLTTTGIAAFGWVLSNAGNYAQIYLHDLTNGKAYKLFYQIGGSWNNNILEITRII